MTFAPIGCHVNENTRKYLKIENLKKKKEKLKWSEDMVDTVLPVWKFTKHSNF